MLAYESDWCGSARSHLKEIKSLNRKQLCRATCKQIQLRLTVQRRHDKLQAAHCAKSTSCAHYASCTALRIECWFPFFILLICFETSWNVITRTAMLFLCAVAIPLHQLQQPFQYDQVNFSIMHGLWTTIGTQWLLCKFRQPAYLHRRST